MGRAVGWGWGWVGGVLSHMNTLQTCRWEAPGGLGRPREPGLQQRPGGTTFSDSQAEAGYHSLEALT